MKDDPDPRTQRTETIVRALAAAQEAREQLAVGTDSRWHVDVACVYLAGALKRVSLEQQEAWK